MAATEMLENSEEEFYRNLLLENPELFPQKDEDDGGIEFTPEPGFVLKSKVADEGAERKVFVNVCTSEHVPKPREVSEKELAEILDSEDPLRYRVPLSLGEPHAELDKSGQGCTVYDIVINPSFLQKVQDNTFFRNFFLTVVFQGLEEKYGLELDRNWTLLKNKKSMGKIQSHCIRKKSKPVIVAMDSNQDEKANKPKEVKLAEPKYSIMLEPEDDPVFVVIEIQLPGIKSANSIELDVGGDRFVVNTVPAMFHLDITLPYEVNNQTCGAQFNKKSKVLTVTAER